MKVLFFLLALFVSVFAKDIEMKGLKIGMTYEEVSKLYKIDKWSFASMKNGKQPTLAGVEVDYMSLEFKNKKLTNISFSFKSKDFYTVFEPIFEKYNDMKCNETKVQNSFGAVFNQVRCNLYDEKSYMSIYKLQPDDITKSYITISEPLSNEDIKKRNENVKKDI